LRTAFALWSFVEIDAVLCQCPSHRASFVKGLELIELDVDPVPAATTQSVAEFSSGCVEHFFAKMVTDPVNMARYFLRISRVSGSWLTLHRMH
jgi:hypothetical protein